MIFKLKDSKEVNLPGFNAFLYNTKQEQPKFNTVYVDCYEKHNKVMVKESHRIYFVIEGQGTFTVNEQTHQVEPNDVIVIEPKTSYEYDGAMKLFEINFPATDETDEISLN